MTTFDEIYDSFLVSIRDHKIDTLYVQSTDDFNNYLLGFMKKAVVKFSNSKQDLSNRNEIAATPTFNITLTPLEIEIISSLMVLEWFQKEINDITQFSLLLNDTDFKTYSSAQNLKEKVSYKTQLKEEISNLMTTYGIQNAPWADWYLGDFSGS